MRYVVVMHLAPGLMAIGAGMRESRMGKGEGGEESLPASLDDAIWALLASVRETGTCWLYVGGCRRGEAVCKWWCGVVKTEGGHMGMSNTALAMTFCFKSRVRQSCPPIFQALHFSVLSVCFGFSSLFVLRICKWDSFCFC